MKEFIVFKREVWVQPMRILAEDEESAIIEVVRGGGEVAEDYDFEYSHDYNSENWTAEVVAENVEK